MLYVFRNSLGRKSLISKEIKNDDLFVQLQSTFAYLPHLTQEENEQELLNLYQSIKRRIEELNNKQQSTQNIESQNATGEDNNSSE
ncbi:hypothetical protein C4M97_00340 [Mycoplasmopsis pullorum]|nr:hypothetical protein [Mycoplasmopsis pullorum]TNK81487.1 hypothetical protein C4M94_04170 [Mycoplasmopsis pullorum]TNK82903.1 hypothetical protein C4M80_01970 [Mycoplasmopsis pullorum]TNK85111.1 hypothetical protein C4M81_00350 [Mycoplasmopsis pullorum]TNK86165.1 hypothetical protein C4M85_01070 [Mycoplasmopsis pullorum]TNK87110.1 hypothetical protein C4M82_00710 [Mycoplasmopsis pullorum]